ncbi:MAG: hypothetical protein M3454_09920 [Actinomycetota bacterium]|nr:hypothetical protein [Actinomycetota bacterium]
MNCGDLQARMASYESGAEPARRELRHLSRCKECAQEMARYGFLAESLAELRSQVVAGPAALEAALIAIPSAPRPRLRPALAVTGHLRRNRRSYASGVALALTAGAATWATRSRRLEAA